MDKLGAVLVEQNLERCFQKLETLQDSQAALSKELDKLQKTLETLKAGTDPINTDETIARIATIGERLEKSTRDIENLRARALQVQTKLS